MADTSDIVPLVLSAILLSLLVFVGVIYAIVAAITKLFVEPALKRFISTMAHVPPHKTTAMVVSDCLGIEATSNLDFFGTIARSSAFTVTGYGAIISAQGVSMQMSLRLAEVLIYNYRMVFNEWPSKKDPLPTLDEIDELGAIKKARDATAEAERAMDYVKRHTSARQTGQRLVTPVALMPVRA